jgi:putative transposase
MVNRNHNLKVKRTVEIYIGENSIISNMCRLSKNQYNQTNYVLRQQFFNKGYAIQRSMSDRQIGSKQITKRERRLFMKRNRKIKGIMHKVSKAIVQYAKSNDIDTIVIGYNNGWKQNVNLGKKNNQKFVHVPFNTLIQQIKYKSEEIEINVIIQNEDHTSKCSFLDNESIEHHDAYMGKRIKRVIFKFKDGILIHADLHGSYNIIRKAVPEAIADGIEGIELYPRSLSLLEFTGMITSEGGC